LSGLPEDASALRNTALRNRVYCLAKLFFERCAGSNQLHLFTGGLLTALRIWGFFSSVRLSATRNTASSRTLTPFFSERLLTGCYQVRIRSSRQIA